VAQDGLGCDPVARRLRVLILGPVNSVHVEHLALGVREQGHDVVVGGDAWEGLPGSVLPGEGVPVSLRTWPTARWLRRLLRETRPDVVHANWLPTAGLAALYGASPLVATAWGSDVYRASRAQLLAYRLLVRQADVVMADSLDLIVELERLGAPPERTMLVNWGVDLSVFSPPRLPRETVRHQLGLASGRMILSPRSLRDVYNPKIIIRAFERVADALGDVTLVLKHMGLEAPELGPLRHSDRVRIIGHVPYERMADYYQAADVCVSLASSDSSPRSVWEAMGCATPCIVSDLPWVHELIVDGQHALVVPIDEDELAAAMRRLLEQPGLGAAMGDRARRLVAEHRNREHELQRLVEVYERVAVRGARHRRLAQGLGATAGLAGAAQAVMRRAVRRGTKSASKDLSL
jgi:glycosyltransferase involved in cell wall biosynthesis